MAMMKGRVLRWTMLIAVWSIGCSDGTSSEDDQAAGSGSDAGGPRVQDAGDASELSDGGDAEPDASRAEPDAAAMGCRIRSGPPCETNCCDDGCHDVRGAVVDVEQECVYPLQEMLTAGCASSIQIEGQWQSPITGSEDVGCYMTRDGQHLVLTPTLVAGLDPTEGDEPWQNADDDLVECSEDLRARFYTTAGDDLPTCDGR